MTIEHIYALKLAQSVCPIMIFWCFATFGCCDLFLSLKFIYKPFKILLVFEIKYFFLQQTMIFHFPLYENHQLINHTF